MSFISSAYLLPFLLLLQTMAEMLLIRALKGGKSTRIITLNGKKMKKMPSALEKLTCLRTLDLQNNQIPKVCPEMSTLTQLTTLNLGNNLLKVVPKEIKYLTSLEKLHLYGNKIHSFEDGACDGLKNLILLNLNNNQLTAIPKEIRRLKQLRHLSVNHNQLNSIPREICFLKNLSELHLNYNKIVCLPKEIKFLMKLEKLHLARNNIEFLPEAICDLTKLRSLDVAGNFIQLFPPRETYTSETWLVVDSAPCGNTAADSPDSAKNYSVCLQNFLRLCNKGPQTGTSKPMSIFSLLVRTPGPELRCLNLKEFYCEGNPLFLKEPVNVVKQDAVWSLQVRNLLSNARKCVVCGELFLTTWLECVEFVHPSKNWKISKNLQLMPLQKLICSYRCFNYRGSNLFGIVQM